ncbi:MAG: hypothetical protein GY869_30775, partial [Planctomycetes bacterium]|nr:hypothetical protein [Planctomycetota bacterium]
SVIFTEPDGTVGTITVKSATGTIIFDGENLIRTEQKGSWVVSGDTGATVAHIALDNTSAATSLSAKATGGYILVNDITINGSAKDIKGKLIDLAGDLTVTGGLAKMEFHDIADQHLITIGESATVPGPVSIKFNQGANLTIDSDTPIKSLTFGNWIDDDAFQDELEADWIGKITTKGNFPADINTTDDSSKYSLGPVKAANITGGTWNVNGHGGKISVNSITGNWAATYTGNLAGLAAKANATGDLTANTIKSVSVKGSYIDGSINLTQSADPTLVALSKLKITGTLDNVDVLSRSGLGGITAGRILDSNIFAGVENTVTDLPDAAGDFDAVAAIKSIKLKGVAGEAIWLDNANIAASVLGKVAVGYAQTDNSGVEFGIATQ